MRKPWIALCTSCFFFVGVIASSGYPAPPIGTRAPALTLERVLQGSDVDVPTWDRLKGKTVVLEFWATWCGPCVGAIRHLNKLATATASERVVYISITDETEEVVRRFLEKRPIQGWVALDKGGATFGAFDIRARPTTIIVDRKGIVRWAGHPDLLNEEVVQTVARGGTPPKIEPVPWPGDGSASVSEPPPLFEISIRPTVGDPRGFSTTNGSGRVEMRGGHIADILPLVLNRSSARIVYLSALDDRRYDVRAIVPSERADLWRGLRAAFEATFGLQVQDERRRVKVWVLRRGTFAEPAVKALSLNIRWSNDAITGTSTVAGLCEMLESSSRQPAIDETGLAGAYEWDLSWDGGREGAEKEAVEKTGLLMSEEEREIEVSVVRSSPNGGATK